MGHLNFPEDINKDERAIKNYLEQFLESARPQTLEKFLLFATGSTILPNLGLGSIDVKFDHTQSIFASTCLLNIAFPNHFKDLETFTLVLKAVIDSAQKSFN